MAAGEVFADGFEKGGDDARRPVVADPAPEATDFKPGDGHAGTGGGKSGGNAREVGEVGAFDDIEGMMSEEPEEVEGEKKRL